MLRAETRICKKCGALYIWRCGGVIMSPLDKADRGLCNKCRSNKTVKILKRLFK